MSQGSWVNSSLDTKSNRSGSLALCQGKPWVGYLGRPAVGLLGTESILASLFQKMMGVSKIKPSGNDQWWNWIAFNLTQHLKILSKNKT